MSGKERIEGAVPLLDDWLFGPSQHGIPADSVPDSDLSTVQLPHNAARLSWKEWDPASWERTWLYRKHFRITRDSGQRHFLNFGAALTVTTPTLNRQPLPAHPGGYSPFQYEITEHVLAENTLDVLLDGRFVPTVPPNWDDAPSTAVDFWQPAGLYRPVTLLSVPTEHIADVFAKPHDVLDPAQRGVDVHCTLDIGEGGRALWVRAELSDDGTVISETTTEVTDPSAGRHPVHLRLGGLERVELWSPDSPKLYDVVVTLSDGANRIHSYRVRTGFRHARFEKSGFYLNGQRYQLFGLSRHQLYPYVGAAMPARAQRRDIELLRDELNCNMIRFSTYPHHEDLLDLCDELGVLVWDEPPGWQFLGTGEWLDNAYRDVRDMILRDRNHPCVVLWAARLNETPGNADYYSETQKLAKSLDDSRQTTGAMLAADHDTTDFQQDVFGYNDYANSTGPDGQRRPELMPPRTDLPYLVSEAVGTLSGPAKFYRRTDPQPVQQGQALAHARVHDLARADAAYAGVIGWVGIDYQSGNGNIDRGLKWPGVIDVFRVPKRGASVYRAQVDPRERIVIEPSFYWDFHPRGPVNELGDRAAIWSNVDRIELFLDGYHHQTLHPASEEFARLPHPPFFADFSRVQPSDLRIDAYLADELVYTRRFTADRTKDRLRLTVDDPELLVGGSDATRVEFRAVDAYGADRPHVDGELTFELHGPAELLGDNPFPMGETGSAGAVWLRSIPDRTGEVRLRAHHPVLGGAEVGLIVISA